ncbi:ABC transporter substrate-binding protein [Spiractinospora alimapuensis]|uniref:helical backbone metal receptor n=1 Tax=Spiractinospora alimapuensis TaxID=2820884 RepID=UPI001F1B6879|nr:helical backbone metal receptor [Spiractinospora alimapuensis]QVQ53305.1 ABC transporter substrate-binding protein [Spiractinospora alimapuensis]
MESARDDTGAAVDLHHPVRRVVSLVPSLTEAVAATKPEAIVGATNWCSRPTGLDVSRVRGTKNPDVEKVLALVPDVVIANAEENRETDLSRLREAGVAVWVTDIRTLPQAVTSLARLFTACGWGVPDWLDTVHDVWGDLLGEPPPPERWAVIPIWRRPWMVIGRDTFGGDLLRRMGVGNIYATHEDRYPKVPLPELNSVPADLVVLPDEPYAFTADDGPESFPRLPAALLEGRHLTWYGPALVEARAALARQLTTLLPPGG